MLLGEQGRDRDQNRPSEHDSADDWSARHEVGSHHWHGQANVHTWKIPIRLAGLLKQSQPPAR